MPVADPVIPVLAEHVRQYPPVRVTLPWGAPDGKPVTRELVFTSPEGLALNRNSFNRAWRSAWRPRAWTRSGGGRTAATC